uniref:Transmembrane protein n=1 Tax=Clastoptera arizonana TaxID=38151 RepID=A0A1B6D827_9HEMI
MASYVGVNNKLAVKDSFDEEDVSDDVDDEVFIRDGKNGFKVDEERGVKRPLMAPRRKFKTNNQFHSDICKKPPCKIFCISFYYAFITIVSLTTLFGKLSCYFTFRSLCHNLMKQYVYTFFTHIVHLKLRFDALIKIILIYFNNV